MMQITDGLLAEVFSIITPGSELGSDREWELMEEFVRRHPGEDLAELIYEAAHAANVEPWKVGTMLDFLIWNTSDNGRGLMKTIEGWLRGGDRLKAGYALSISYVFPYHDESEMAEVLHSVGARWSELESRCREIIALRAHQPHSAT